MRINRYLASATDLSRRAADRAIADKRVYVNGHLATAGLDITEQDAVTLDGVAVQPVASSRIILLNKPAGYVVSREGQGSKTIYDLLPPELHRLNPIGRLDKESSGLLLLTDDGDLHQQLTHPKYMKEKRYQVTLDKPLAVSDRAAIQKGIPLEDGTSRLQLEPLSRDGKRWVVSMYEGRNRQIRRTFQARSYTVRTLHRIQFGTYSLPAELLIGHWQDV